jgi:hypothetical protein
LQDFQKEVETAGLEMDEIRHLPPETLMKEAAIHDWIMRASEQMRFAVQVVSGMFDPEIIVLGGALPVGITTQLVKNINDTPVPAPSRGLDPAPVVATRLGALNGPIGAASIPFFRTFFPGSS